MKTIFYLLISKTLLMISAEGYSLGVQNTRDSSIGVWYHYYSPNAPIGPTKPTIRGDFYRTQSLKPIGPGELRRIKAPTWLREGAHMCIYAGGLIPRDYSHHTEIFRAVPGDLTYEQYPDALWKFRFSEGDRFYKARGWKQAHDLMQGKAYFGTAYCTRDLNHIFVID